MSGTKGPRAMKRRTFLQGLAAVASVAIVPLAVTKRWTQRIFQPRLLFVPAKPVLYANVGGWTFLGDAAAQIRDGGWEEGAPVRGQLVFDDQLGSDPERPVYSMQVDGFTREEPF